MHINLYDKRRLGLYIHIPFCMSKCAYCDFNSFVPDDDEIVNRYVSALISHMSDYKRAGKDYVVDTVYIGGGTPTSIPTEELARLIKAIKRNFDVSKKAEFSVEVNPGTADYSKFKKLRKLGVNRLSIGLQSAENEELEALSRTHTRRDFINCYRAARQAKFDNINVDLMFGIPRQTYESMMRSLDFVTRMNPEHISFYNLKIEPGTPFYMNRLDLSRILPDEDTEVKMYLGAISFLASRGYMQYEISNFSRQGFKCLHNLKYWNCEEYLGIGASAHSYFNSNRFAFIDDVSQYMAGVEVKESNVSLTSENETLETRERMGEYIMLRLRLTEGINSLEFARRFGVSFESLYGGKILKYLKNGYMARRSGTYFLTPRGMFVSNYILSDILEFEDLGSYAGNII